MCGCRYGLGGPSYGKNRVTPGTCRFCGVRQTHAMPLGAESVGSWHQPHWVVQMFAGRPRTAGGGCIGGAGGGVCEAAVPPASTTATSVETAMRRLKAWKG